MSNNFTDQEKIMLDKLQANCAVGKWYNMDKKRPDYEVLFSTVSKMAIYFGTAEIYDDSNSKFRFIYRENVVSSLVSSIESLQSKEMYSVDEDTKEKNKSLKSKEKMSNFKEVPGVCSRPDLVKEILDKEEDERKRNMYVDTRAEKQKKIKDWINGDNIHNV